MDIEGIQKLLSSPTMPIPDRVPKFSKCGHELQISHYDDPYCAHCHMKCICYKEKKEEN